jgi:hypothetical protein
MCTNYCSVVYYFKFAPFLLDTCLRENLTSYCIGLKSIACVAFVGKAANEIRIMPFFKYFRVKKLHELLIATNKLTNNFTDQVTNDIGTDVT